MDDNTIMKFGAHKGKQLIDVPPSYLLWIYGEENCPDDLKAYIKENMDVIIYEFENDEKGNENDFVHISL